MHVYTMSIYVYTFLCSPWPQIGIINTSEGAKIYLMPTCIISHELGKQNFVVVVSYHLPSVYYVGITHANHPQMLHGIFVKKIHRESTLIAPS